MYKQYDQLNEVQKDQVADEFEVYRTDTNRYLLLYRCNKEGGVVAVDHVTDLVQKMINNIIPPEINIRSELLEILLLLNEVTPAPMNNSESILFRIKNRIRNLTNI